MSKVKCDICGRKFTSDNALEMHTKAKHPKKEEKQRKRDLNKLKKWAIAVVVVSLFVGAIWIMASNVKTLPPTTMQGHIEVNPPSHVMRQPMDLAVQKHMLEHADGGGPPGVVINYNCADYECASDLIPNLEAFAEEFPQHVYVAPFPNMDAKIALTKLGRIQTLDSYDEQAIRSFITG